MTELVISEHHREHIRELAEAKGISEQLMLDKILSAPFKSWCQECWPIWADGQTLDGG